mmetsp:Transcript_44732/g.101020  ORF Transcript_44732/g.101020 Transcript_44732/m.101020 type:complete len:286 (+) Transcript_44732:76-933(+)
MVSSARTLLYESLSQQTVLTALCRVCGLCTLALAWRPSMLHAGCTGSMHHGHCTLARSAGGHRFRSASDACRRRTCISTMSHAFTHVSCTCSAHPSCPSTCSDDHTLIYKHGHIPQRTCALQRAALPWQAALLPLPHELLTDKAPISGREDNRIQEAVQVAGGVQHLPYPAGGRYRCKLEHIGDGVRGLGSYEGGGVRDEARPEAQVGLGGGEHAFFALAPLGIADQWRLVRLRSGVLVAAARARARAGAHPAGGLFTILSDAHLSFFRLWPLRVEQALRDGRCR